MKENEIDYKALYEEAFAKEIEPGTSGYSIAYRDKDGKDLNGIPWLDGVYLTTEELNEGIQNLKDHACIDITPYKIDGEQPETVTWD